MPEDLTTSNDYIRAMARSEAKVEALTESMRELKRAVEELIDRVDADVDALRTKAESFGVIAAAVDELKRREAVLETKIENFGTEQAALKTGALDRDRRVTILETTVEALKVRVWMASGAFGVIAFIAGKLFK